MEKVKLVLKAIGRTVKKVGSSKILLTFCIGMLWLTFNDGYSILDYFQYNMKVRQLTNEVNYYEKQIEDCNQKMLDMKTDKESLEKYARENYFMKKKDEEIFVVKD
ncbi:MAG: septum formation initiator family protein [Paludibacteraceae bacterium]|nr:septum formation initiator family protein [Paludibacteraceae bacterium]